jgi:hypothetical protein
LRPSSFILRRTKAINSSRFCTRDKYRKAALLDRGKFTVDKCGIVTVLVLSTDYRVNIIEVFERYCAATGNAPATVSTKVMNHGEFYKRIKAGSDFTTDTYERVMEWFRVNKPQKRTRKKV